MSNQDFGAVLGELAVAALSNTVNDFIRKAETENKNDIIFTLTQWKKILGTLQEIMKDGRVTGTDHLIVKIIGLSIMEPEMAKIIINTLEKMALQLIKDFRQHGVPDATEILIANAPEDFNPVGEC